MLAQGYVVWFKQIDFGKSIMSRLLCRFSFQWTTDCGPFGSQSFVHWKLIALIKCPKCNKTFSQKNKMRTHLLICGNQDKPFPCSECDEAFQDWDGLHIHKKQKHPQRAGDSSA